MRKDKVKEYIETDHNMRISDKKKMLGKESEAFMEKAAEWVQRLGYTVDLAYVMDDRFDSPWALDANLASVVHDHWDFVVAQSRRSLEKLQEHFPSEHRGRSYVLFSNKPALTLLNLAENYEAILVGTHGRVGIQRAWLGSVAERLVRLSPISVVVLRLRPEEEAERKGRLSTTKGENGKQPLQA